MTDFLTHLVERARGEGMTPAVRPRVPSVFESGPAGAPEPAMEAAEVHRTEPPTSAGEARYSPSLRPAITSGTTRVEPAETRPPVRSGGTDPHPAPSAAVRDAGRGDPAASAPVPSPGSSVWEPARSARLSTDPPLSESVAPVAPPPVPVAPRGVGPPAMPPTVPPHRSHGTVIEPRRVEGESLPHPVDAGPDAVEDGPAPVTVRVSIGRIEVRAVAEPPAPAPAPRAAPPRLGLEEYLRQRTRGER